MAATRADTLDLSDLIFFRITLFFFRLSASSPFAIATKTEREEVGERASSVEEERFYRGTSL